MKKLYQMLAVMGILGMSQAHAAGFALIEQSVSGMGTAYAGSGSTAEDATTVWFNPAGMSKFCTPQIVSGVQGIFPRARFHNDDSTLSPGLGGTRLRGGSGGNCGVKAALPSFYYVRPLSCGWTFGLGVNSPFGLATHYESNWVGRYYGRYSKILTLNINPSLSYQICDNLSIGAGFNAQYLRATLTNSVDFGSIIFALTQGQLGARQGQDGRAKIKGDSWGFGGNVGLLWDINCQTSLGLAYRSEIRQHIKGHVDYDNVPAFPPGLRANFQDVNVNARVTLPSTVLLSGVHHVNCNWDVMADIMWTKWDSVKRLRVKFEEPSPQADSVVTLRWKNKFRYALGSTYRVCEGLKLRAGLAYDQAPTPNRELRNVRIPDTNRFWTSVGLGYDWNCNIHLDLGYSHLFVRDFKIDKSESLGAGEENFFNGRLKGKYKASTDIVGAQIVYNF
jgi:long-chain fatty acid transport protein